MLRANYRFPIVSGDMLAEYRAGLAVWANLDCLPKRPDVMPKRLLTLREDAGPESQGVAVWGYGVNVWADSELDAKNIALDAASISLTIPGLVGGVKAVRDLVGPSEVPDDPVFTFNGAPLAHFYFSFDAVVKATAV